MGVLVVTTAAMGAAPAGTDYRIEAVPDPDTALLLEVGGMDFSKEGTLFVGTRRGEVWAWKDKQWKRFASGLAECLGVMVVSEREVVVTQRGEVSRLKDMDGDGVAERFECVTQGFAYGGNYHEFNFGVVKDTAGNLYGALNLQHTNHDPWGGQYMGADIKDRGTGYVVSPSGKYETFCWGLRSPNGLVMSPGGEIFCAESQGEFVATNCIYQLKRGGFYGHPASLSFKEGFTGSPQTTTIQDLAKMRSGPAVWIPYKRLGQSVNGPVFDTTGGKFGPFVGQMFVGDCNAPVVNRVVLEKVGGEYQGAVFPFLNERRIEGANRFAFGPDGAMYAGLTNRGWAAGTYGIRKITWTGVVPLEVERIEIARDGFVLKFTKDVPPAAAEAGLYQLLSYRYEYHKEYGCDELDKGPVRIARVEKVGERGIKLVLEEVVAGRVYEFAIGKVKASDGAELRTGAAWYTVNRVKE